MVSGELGQHGVSAAQSAPEELKKGQGNVIAQHQTMVQRLVLDLVLKNKAVQPNLALMVIQFKAIT